MDLLNPDKVQGAFIMVKRFRIIVLKGYIDFWLLSRTSVCEFKYGVLCVELMASFVEDKKIKQDFKAKLVGAVLNGYLSLRR